jgi:hypothetical protein
MGPRQLETFIAIVAFKNFKTLRAQLLRDGAPQSVIIIDDQKFLWMSTHQNSELSDRIG